MARKTPRLAEKEQAANAAVKKIEKHQIDEEIRRNMKLSIWKGLGMIKMKSKNHLKNLVKFQHIRRVRKTDCHNEVVGARASAPLDGM